MRRYAPKTLRRMPATTSEVALLANELASVQPPYLRISHLGTQTKHNIYV